MEYLLNGKKVIVLNMDFEISCIFIVNESDYLQSIEIIKKAAKQWEERDTVGDLLSDVIAFALEEAGIDFFMPKFEEVTN